MDAVQRPSGLCQKRRSRRCHGSKLNQPAKVEMTRPVKPPSVRSVKSNVKTFFVSTKNLAARSRLSPFRNLAKTIRQHWDGTLAYFDTKRTFGTIEAVNGIIQLTNEWLGDFKNFATSEPPPTTNPVSSNWTSQSSTNSESTHRTANEY
jgi:Transposase